MPKGLTLVRCLFLRWVDISNVIYQGQCNVKLGRHDPGRYSRFQVIEMIEWGQKIKTQKSPHGFQQNPRKSLDNKLTPDKTHAESRLKNFQNALNDIA